MRYRGACEQSGGDWSAEADFATAHAGPCSQSPAPPCLSNLQPGACAQRAPLPEEHPMVSPQSSPLTTPTILTKKKKQRRKKDARSESTTPTNGGRGTSAWVQAPAQHPRQLVPPLVNAGSRAAEAPTRAEPSDVPTAASRPSFESSKHAPGASSNRRNLRSALTARVVTRGWEGPAHKAGVVATGGRGGGLGRREGQEEAGAGHTPRFKPTCSTPRQLSNPCRFPSAALAQGAASRQQTATEHTGEGQQQP